MQVLLSVTHKKYSEIASLDKNVSMQVHHSPPLEVQKKMTSRKTDTSKQLPILLH